MSAVVLALALGLSQALASVVTLATALTPLDEVWPGLSKGRADGETKAPCGAWCERMVKEGLEGKDEGMAWVTGT
jgi:hypothetical protein